MKLNENRLNLPVIGMEVELNVDDEHTFNEIQIPHRSSAAIGKGVGIATCIRPGDVHLTIIEH